MYIILYCTKFARAEAVKAINDDDDYVRDYVRIHVSLILILCLYWKLILHVYSMTCLTKTPFTVQSEAIQFANSVKTPNTSCQQILLVLDVTLSTAKDVLVQERRLISSMQLSSNRPCPHHSENFHLNFS